MNTMTAKQKIKMTEKYDDKTGQLQQQNIKHKIT